MTWKKYITAPLVVAGMVAVGYGSCVGMSKGIAAAFTGRNPYGATVQVANWDLSSINYSKFDGDCVLHEGRFLDFGSKLGLHDDCCDGVVDKIGTSKAKVRREGNYDENLFHLADVKYNRLLKKHDLTEKLKEALAEEEDWEKFF